MFIYDFQRYEKLGIIGIALADFVLACSMNQRGRFRRLNLPVMAQITERIMRLPKEEKV